MIGVADMRIVHLGSRGAFWDLELFLDYQAIKLVRQVTNVLKCLEQNFKKKLGVKFCGWFKTCAVKVLGD